MAYTFDVRNATVIAALLVGVASTSAGNAHADDSEWYGYQTLLSDGLAIGILVGTGKTDHNDLALAGLAVYVAGAPIVHLAKGSASRAAKSLGLRVGLPLAGGVVGLALGGDGLEALGGAAMGTLLGVISAIAADAIWVANGPDPDDARPRMLSFGGSF